MSAGKVGAVLGSALRAVDHQVIGVHAVSQASRERAETLLPGVPRLEVEEILERCELVLLAVPDDALAPLVRGLADLGRWQAGQIVVHTSGRYGVRVLEPAARCGAIPLAVHPVGCPMAVTAPAVALPIAQALAVELGGEPFVLEESARPAYHAALTHGANHLVTLVGQAVRVLAAAGVDDGGQVLRPLLTAALERALSEGADAALTGPVARGDAGTVRVHLDTLAGLDDGTGAGLDDVVESYRVLARATLERRVGRLGPEQAAALREVLGDC